MTHSAKAPSSRSAPVPARRGRPLDIVAAVSLLACAVGLCVALQRTATWETWLARHIVGWALDTPTQLMPAGDVFYFDVGTGRDQGMHLTLACSIVLLLTPLLGVAATMLVTGRVRVLKALTATVCASVALVLVNQLRLLAIATAARRWGDSGFGWAHTVVGSALVLVGLASVLVLFFHQLGTEDRKD